MRRLAAALALGLALFAGTATAEPQATEGTFVLEDFRFRSGEVLPRLKLHYRTLGAPRRDADGRVTNAVLLLHGTGGDGRQFLSPSFAGPLMAPGGPLDPARWFLILPDSIGHGGSSKPSDGLAGRFPRYDYDDMVAAQRALVREGLGVDRLRLVIGASMGCMHTFVWGVAYPTDMDALLPLACLPAPVAGRNRLFRKAMIDAIESDPAFHGGDYAEPPRLGLRNAAAVAMVMSDSPARLHQAYPSGQAADDALAKAQEMLRGVDANDMIRQLDASRTYDPSSGLASIRARVLWINSADDPVNPPEVGVAERAAARLANGKFVLIPTGPDTKGHLTVTNVALWRDELRQLLAKLGEPPR